MDCRCLITVGTRRNANSLNNIPTEEDTMNDTKNPHDAFSPETETERPLRYLSGDMTLLQAIESVLTSDPDPDLRELLWKIISVPKPKKF